MDLGRRGVVVAVDDWGCANCVDETEIVFLRHSVMVYFVSAHDLCFSPKSVLCL